MLAALRRLLASARERAAAFGPDREAGHSGWDYVPSWQYNGRHVESGGMTRDDQEKALREVQERAAETERELRK